MHSIQAAHLAAMGLLATLAVAAVPTAGAAEEKRLYIYNWTDFIGPQTIAEFEKLTGIKVVYDVYDAEETMEARLLAGDSGYDVVIASTDYFSREIKAGVYETLDKSKLPNWKNLDPRILAIQSAYDPGNAHAVPYLHSINGFAYNVDMIKARMPDAPVDSLDMLFKPEVVSKFADCGVTFLDSAEDTIQLALKYLGLDPNYHQARGFQGRRGFAPQGAPLRSLFRFLRILERAREQGGLRRDVLVERLCAVARAGEGGRASTSTSPSPCRRRAPTRSSPRCSFPRARPIPRPPINSSTSSCGRT